MDADPTFNSTENQALLVVCARKTIRNTGIGAIIWGVINLGIGYVGIQVSILNIFVLALAFLMLGTGILALTKPSLHALLAAAVVSTLLLFWNLSVMTLNMIAGSPEYSIGGGFVMPLIIAVVFFRQYLKLQHLKEDIASMDHLVLKEATGLCKQLFKSKLKESPDIAEASSRRCRMRFMSDAVFCAQRNLSRAFYMSRANFQECIKDTRKKRIRVVVRHPLGKLTYAFDKKNSEKIRGWLSASPASIS
jgi:hypothetical protein